MSDAAFTVGNLAFDRTGEGQPLLLLHGTGSSRGVWKPVIPLLAGEREVIALDLPGHGASPLVAGIEPTLIGYARVVASILDRLALASVDVGEARTCQFRSAAPAPKPPSARSSNTH